MTPRYHTTGNAQSWRVRGYQDRPAVPGPITTDEPPLNYGVILAGPMIGLAVLLFSLIVGVLL